jgi:hypothetical protein
MKQWGIVVIIALMIVVFPTSAIELDVSTSIPEYILEDYLNLTGNASGTIGNWSESENLDFLHGSTHNLTVSADSILLEPSLDIQMLNDGRSILDGGGSGAWDEYIGLPEAIVVNGTYYIYYVGARGSGWTDGRQHGVATSTDGINFTKYSGNPILRWRVDSFDYDGLMNHHIFYENDTWKLWYTGLDTSGYYNICYATSVDGFNWTKYSGNPVISHGARNNDWDGIEVRPNYVIKDTNYKMYFTGRGSSGVLHLGLAVSVDGVTWAKDSNNPLRTVGAGTWENGNTRYKTVESSNDTYRMWIHAGPPRWKIGYLTSTDGLDWTLNDGVVLTPKPGTIYSSQVILGTVLDLGDHYLFYLHCRDMSSKRSTGVFKATPENMNGTYTSRLFDAGGVVNLDDITWEANVSAGGSLDFSVRWGNETSSLSQWHRVSTPSSIGNITARYLQYRADFHAHKDWFTVRLNRVAINYTHVIDSVQVRVDGGVLHDAVLEDGEWYLNLSLTDGDHLIVVEATDTKGNYEREEINVKVDLFPPIGSILLEDGKNATNSTDISYTISAEDTHGITHQMISFTDGFTGLDWEPYDPIGNLDYDGPDGDVKVFAKVMDGSGRVSDIIEDSIIVDTTPPIGTLEIEEGTRYDSYTNDRNITLIITWTDLSGVVQMMISNDPDFSGATWRSAGNTVPWSLDDVEGGQTVYVRLRDAVGWTTDISDDIILDRTPPTARFIINEDDPYTSDKAVTLYVTVDDVNPTQVQLRNKGNPWNGIWYNLISPAQHPWTFEDGDDGSREVSMLVRDMAGNEIVVSDVILLDTTPPEAKLNVEGGNQFISELLSSVQLIATDATSGVAKMRMSNTGYFTDVAWLEFSEESNWLFPEGEGMKTLFAQVMDGVGLITSLDATVIMDTTAPTGTFTINEGDEHVRTSQVTLRLAFGDDFGVDVVRVSNSPGFEDSEWVAYSATMSWDLLEEGDRVVYLEVRDEAGNIVSADSSIIYDATPPIIEYLSPKKRETMEEKVTVEVSIVDAVDLAPTSEWRLDDGAWEALVGTIFQVKLADGDHVIEVRATDGAGNEAVEALKLKKEPEPSIASGPLLWIIILVVVVVIGVVYWQWRGKGTTENP